MSIRRSFLACVLISAIGAALFTLLAGAQISVNPPVRPRHPAAITVRIDVKDKGEVDALSKAGFDISSVKDHTATLHVSQDELASLHGAGYVVEEIEAQKALPGYPAYTDITTRLQQFTSDYQAITRLESIGKSIEGRDLWAMLITGNPGVEEDEPEFKYVSTIHGDESLGTVLCMNLIEKLLTGYGADDRATRLVDTTGIWIVPVVNPDGYEHGYRFNAANIDLNRDFPIYPDQFDTNRFDGGPLLEGGRQPETAAMMQWTAQNSFVLSANFHTGSLLVNYPYDDNGGPSGVDAPTSDDALFEDLSQRYSVHNMPMFQSARFPNGISNGAAWYVIQGGMQDWMYRYASCFEVTIELSDTTSVPMTQVAEFWSQNEESMMAYLEAVHIGARGLVSDAATGAPVYAKVNVEGNSQAVFTDPDVGDYHRLLLPGMYNLTFSAQGYESKTVRDVVVADGHATRLDIALSPPDTDVPPGDSTPSTDPLTGGSAPSCPAQAAFTGQPAVLSKLRAFRDLGLKRTALGRGIVKAYYAAAPFLARRVATSKDARQVFVVAAGPFATLGAFLKWSEALEDLAGL